VGAGRAGNSKFLNILVVQHKGRDPLKLLGINGTGMGCEDVFWIQESYKG